MSLRRIPQPYSLVRIIQDEPLRYGGYSVSVEKNGILYKWTYSVREPWERRSYEGLLLRD